MAIPSDRLTVFHYHLSRGGVTEVIASSLEAILRHVPDIGSVTIACGNPDNTDALGSRLRPIALECGKDFAIDVFPELGYLEMNTRPDPALTGAIRSILSGYRGSIWWVHNYHLGKNPIFTELLLELLIGHEDQPAILHVHDFPECSRYSNLSFLNRHLTHPPYPVRPNVRYAVINARDKDLLVRAGIPGSHVFLLNNPITPSLLDRSNSTKTIRSLRAAFGSDFPGFAPGRPLVLYPVRTIRRKNVLELGLIAALDPAGPNLAVTLPGVSQLERPYSDIVERAFRERLIPGLWGIGTRLGEAGIDFSSLLAAADMIGSSSVQEGFGYLYVDAGQMGIPLIARRLDVLGGIMDVFDLQRCSFYDSLLVSVDRSAATLLRDAYRTRIGNLGVLLDDAVIRQLEAEIARMFEGGTADFSFLSVENQYEILVRVQNDFKFAQEIRALNQGLFDALEELHGLPVLDSGSLDPRFTVEGVARGINEILGSFGGTAEGDYDSELHIQRRLVQEFARIEYLRLLYG